MNGLGYFPGKLRARIPVRISFGVSLAGLVVDDSVVDDLLLNVTDFRRDRVPGVLRMPAFDGLDGDS